ncbi:MAG: hypothetical protein K2X38_06290 [Gemmataceae bacterium]|nr:hypothetical protein [Gemmataceae bacterium]
MTNGNQPELVLFQEFLASKIQQGDPGLTPEEVLLDWREEHPLEEIDEREVKAIQEALDDYEKGDRGVPLEEFMERFSRYRKADKA